MSIHSKIHYGYDGVPLDNCSEVSEWNYRLLPRDVVMKCMVGCCHEMALLGARKGDALVVFEASFPKEDEKVIHSDVVLGVTPDHKGVITRAKEPVYRVVYWVDAVALSIAVDCGLKIKDFWWMVRHSKSIRW
jgi:hypothetical protein